MRAVLLLFPLLFSGVGCARNEPYQRAGGWRPTGANFANLRATVNTPAHLINGVGAEGSNGHLAASAVNRLNRGEIGKLPTADVARIAIMTAAPDGPSAAVAAQAGF